MYNFCFTEIDDCKETGIENEDNVYSQRDFVFIRKKVYKNMFEQTKEHENDRNKLLQFVFYHRRREPISFTEYFIFNIKLQEDSKITLVFTPHSVTYKIK